MTQTPDPMDVARTRVGNGLRWLQEHGPRFDTLLARVDIRRIDMQSGDSCVLAQAHWSKNYVQALADIHGAYDRENLTTDAWAAEHGFQHGICFSAEKPVPDFDHLKQAWAEVLGLEGSGYGG